MQLHAWYKPRFRFTYDGAPWTTDGRIAVAVDAAPDGIEEHTGAANTVRFESGVAIGDPVVRTQAIRGYALVGDHAYQAHYIDLCEAAHPGIVWRIVGSGIAPSAVGFIGDRPVAVVMGIRVDGQDPADWPERFPPCPTCDGKGGPECTACEGSGEAECPMCGHEDECDECNGEGHTDGCLDCGGTGKWSPKEAA